MTAGTDYTKELVEDARDVQADKKDRWTFERWFKIHQEAAEAEDKEAPREEDLKRAWAAAKPKRKKYPPATEALVWRKHPVLPIEATAYANARWVTDGFAGRHKAGEWLNLVPDGFGDVFFRIWDTVSKRDVYLSPGRLLVETGWLTKPKYMKRKRASLLIWR